MNRPLLEILGALAIVIRQSFLAAPTRPPAVLFPLVMSGAMIGSAVSRCIAALIAASALLFPLAHVGGVAGARISGDIILLVAFWWLARQMLRADPPISRGNTTARAGASRG